MSIAIFRPLSIRNFRLLWIGSVLSMLGGQLTMIAFPWLVLRLTGDPLAMGTVLALETIPRALFMLFGGVLTDRFSARAVMIWCNVVRGAMVLLLAWLVVSGQIAMWQVYVVALLFGVVDAFAWPASSALLPQIVPAVQLPPANALLQGSGQISVMLGPAIAGILIALFEVGATGDAVPLTGIALVFAMDCVGFVFSTITLVLIRLPGVASATMVAAQSMIAAIREGFAALWGDLPLRIVTLVFMLFSLFWRGPYMIGVPVLCDARFPEGALAFGMIGSAYGVGAFIGTVAAGSLPQPGERWYGGLILLDIVVLGATMLVFAFTPTVDWALVACVLSAMVDGYLTILLISWIQARIAMEIMGRVMSVIMFCISGLAPVSAALAGALIKVSLVGVFVGAGGVLVVLGLLGFLMPVVRTLGLEARPKVAA